MCVAEAAKRGLNGPSQVRLDEFNTSLEDVILSLVKEKVREREVSRSLSRLFRDCETCHQGLPNGHVYALHVSPCKR